MVRTIRKPMVVSHFVCFQVKVLKTKYFALTSPVIQNLHQSSLLFSQDQQQQNVLSHDASLPLSSLNFTLNSMLPVFLILLIHKIWGLGSIFQERANHKCYCLVSLLQKSFYIGTLWKVYKVENLNIRG